MKPRSLCSLSQNRTKSFSLSLCVSFHMPLPVVSSPSFFHCTPLSHTPTECLCPSISLCHSASQSLHPSCPPLQSLPAPWLSLLAPPPSHTPTHRVVCHLAPVEFSHPVAQPGYPSAMGSLRSISY